MKIASKKPVEIKSPVRVTDTQYDMWYARPVLLGRITREGNFWYTADGMRFASSRNALDYLITLRDLLEKELQVDQKFHERIIVKEPTVTVRKGAVGVPRKKKEVNVGKQGTRSSTDLRPLGKQMHDLLVKLGYHKQDDSTTDK